jgi:GDP-4-dehydro-6-deoxy-D-mannose reductase
MYRRAIVTGAQGFIGRYLVSELHCRGIEVTTIGRKRSGNTSHAVIEMQQWNQPQLSAILAEAQPDIIFHFAGSSIGSATDLKTANIETTEILLSALKNLKQSPALVLAGSAAEYGAGIVDGVPVTEDTPCIPVSNYGASKLIQTQLALQFAGETGAKVVSARIFNAIGPGMPGHLALGSFAAQIASFPGTHGELLTGNLEVYRDFIDVKQVATSLLDIAVNPNADGVVNICSGQPVQLRNLVNLLIAASGKDILITNDPARMRPGELNIIIGSTNRLTKWRTKILPENNFTNLMNEIWLAAESAQRLDNQNRHKRHRANSW